jgi:type 1 glutamine amidotransferase
LTVLLLADKKDHGPAGNGMHDYPVWQESWARLLGGAPSVKVLTAQQWPTEEQFKAADVVAAFCYLKWDAQRIEQVRNYLARGKGLVLIHSATWTKPKPSAEVASVTGVGGFLRHRMGVMKLRVEKPDHPICAGLPREFELDDEPYWPPTPDPVAPGYTALAVSQEQDGPQPMFWTCQPERGRVFGCVPGHFTRTFDDPHFRLLLLRGIAWAGGTTPSRFDSLVKTLRISAGRGKFIEMLDTSDETRGLDLSRLKLESLYETDFTGPLKFVKETDLFTDGKRTRLPTGVDWVLEGKASARIENGRLVLKNDASHLVFWNTREFPADMLIEFGVSPADPNNGLNIVFFAAKGRDGGSIFDMSQPLRDGEFKTYHSGEINNYHVSYWAITPTGEARGTANIRKNHGFHLVSMGNDLIAGQGAGPHRIRILKLGNQITVEANGKIEVRFEDDGKTFGPVWKEGRVGLRQMQHTGQCSYTHFKVWAAKPTW